MFRQHERLCVSASTAATSSAKNWARPTRKRYYATAFAEEIGPSPDASQKQAKAASQGEDQVKAEKQKQMAKSKNMQETGKTGSKFFHNFADSFFPPTSNFLVETSLDLKSCYSSTPSHPPNPTMLSLKHPNKAAAEVAAAYVQLSASEKKPQCISVANNRLKQFGSVQNNFSTNASSTPSVKQSNHQDKPLDLSVKTAKKDIDAKKHVENIEKVSSAAWQQSLSLYFQAGQHYGSFFPSVYQPSPSLSPAIFNPLQPQMPLSASYWQPHLPNFHQPFGKTFPMSVNSSILDTTISTEYQVSNSQSQSFNSSSIPSHGEMIQKESTVLSTADANYSKARYSCQFCPKDFPRKANLIRHELTHTGEQPYSCRICKKGFSFSFNMQRHMKRIHSKVN